MMSYVRAGAALAIIVAIGFLLSTAQPRKATSTEFTNVGFNTPDQPYQFGDQTKFKTEFSPVPDAIVKVIRTLNILEVISSGIPCGESVPYLVEVSRNGLKEQTLACGAWME